MSAQFPAVADGLFLALLALALRLFCLGCESLWIDELFSVHWSQLDLPFLLGEGARTETNPPTYYVFLHGWMTAFGSGEATVRLFSALASSATAPVVYSIGRGVADRTAGLLAGLFFALNPVATSIAQEARPYALSSLLAGLALAALLRCHQCAEAPPRRPLAGFVMASVAAGWVHYTALLFVAACFGVTGLRLMATRPFPPRAAALWCGAAAATAAALAPIVLLAASLSGSNNLVWIEPLSVQAMLGFILDLVLALPRTGPFFLPTLAVLALLALIIAASWPRLRALGWPFLALALVPCLYFALLVLVSIVRPILLVRVATWMVIPLCVVLALAAVVQPSRTRRMVVCLWPLLVFPAGLACHHFLFPWKDDWRSAARLIETDPRCRGPVLVGEFNPLGALYYGLYRQRPVLAFLPDPGRRDSAEFRLSQRLMHLPGLDPDAVPGFIASHPGTAVVVRLGTVGLLPEALRTLVERAPFRPQVTGLTLVCF